MKCIVLGSNGMLGSTLSRKLEESGVTVSRFDKRIEACDDLPDLSAYDVSFNCIGAIHQKGAGLDQMTWANIVIPRMLARSANKLVHFSTDCVFSGGLINGEYRWDDSDWATDDYGWTKRQGEILDSVKVLTIRMSVIGHRGPAGLLEWLLLHDHSRNAGRAVVYGFTNHFWNGFTTNELSNVMIDNLARVITSSGLWQLSGERVSKFELLHRLVEVYGIDVDLVPTAKGSGTNKCMLSNVSFVQPKRLCDQISEMYAEENRWNLRGRNR